jgi:hypothetical protein
LINILEHPKVQISHSKDHVETLKNQIDPLLAPKYDLKDYINHPKDHINPLKDPQYDLKDHIKGLLEAKNRLKVYP